MAQHPLSIRSTADQTTDRGPESAAAKPTVVAARVKGGFRVSVPDLTWWWSPGMLALHGYTPGRGPAVVPSSSLIMSHRHPGDRKALSGAWSQLHTDDGIVVFHYRIVGDDAVTRPVFVMASTEYDDDHRPVAISGVLEEESPSGLTGR